MWGTRFPHITLLTIVSNSYERIRQSPMKLRLKKLNQQEYEIFQLDSSNKELINLLSTDKVLKNIIIRAEGYRIIVESRNVAKLKAHLKSYGYLI